MPAGPPVVHVRLAAMVDVLRTVPVQAVDDPALVQAGKANAPRPAPLHKPAHHLPVGDAVTGVLNNDLARGDYFAREHAAAVNPGAANLEPET